MSATDSDQVQKVADIVRNRWPTYSGFGGRHAPESLAAMGRITHLVGYVTIDFAKP